MKLKGITSEDFKLKSAKGVTVTLKGLTAAQRLDILARIQNSQQYGSAMLDAAKFSITSWAGITADSGAPADVTPENIELLPLDALIEIGNKVLQVSALNAGEKKA